MTVETHDWAEIERTFPYAEAMRHCVQDPVHHAEGDVLTHIKMIMDALNSDDRALRLAVLYHDCMKPATRVVEYDAEQQRKVVRHPNHAHKGAAVAWHDLWLAGEALDTRLAVYWMCLWHQRVFHIWEQDDMMRFALSYAYVGSWPKLIEFARADNAGRICANQRQANDNLDLLEEFLDDRDRPRIDAKFFATEHDRLFYFEKDGRSPYYEAQEPSGSRVIILCGLPAAGKDSHCTRLLGGIATVSLDSIRNQLNIAPEHNQGRVIQAAFEQARACLRERRPFVWNAQCVTRQARDKIIRLCRAYDAHVTIHAFDRPLPTILAQNRCRERQVPQAVILAAARKWEPPSLLEAHRVEWIR